MEEITIPKGYKAKIEGDKVVFIPNESEDERAIKNIRIALLSMGDNLKVFYETHNTSEEELLAYLERQKSTLSDSEKDFADTYSKGVWEKLMSQFKTTEGFRIGCNDVSDIVLNAILDAFKWAKSRRTAAEWGEKDKTIIEGACNALEVYGHIKLANMLKSLRPQPKQEWSEEDARKLNRIAKILVEGSYVQNWWKTHRLLEREEMETLIDFLKSLAPQSNWKPSEKEKGAIRTAIHVLTEIRNFPRATEQLQNILNAFEGKESRKDWKPSEEEMKALKNVVETYRQRHNVSVGGDCIFVGIESLYNKLSNLRQ